MTDIQFYHLLSTSLERALPKLLEKAVAGQYRIVVKVASEEDEERLDTELWTYNPGSFLPHGTRRDGFEAEQPIYITANGENPGGATLLVVTDGSPAPEGYARVLDIFNGVDDAAVQAARGRWSQYKTEGHSLAYIKQTPAGGWEKVMESAA